MFDIEGIILVYGDTKEYVCKECVRAEYGVCINSEADFNIVAYQEASVGYSEECRPLVDDGDTFACCGWCGKTILGDELE